MDEGRLAAVRRRTDHNRKNVIVMNDIIKNRQEVYENYLNKEQHGVESKIIAGELGLKRNIVRNNVLMQCLEARKEKMKMKNPGLPLGKYGGRPIHTFSRDIESMISWMHPRLRRLRQVERMKQNGLRVGAIIDPSTVPARIDAVFGERSNSDSRILAGQNISRRKSSTTRRRRLSKSGGLLDPLARQPMALRRRKEAPPARVFMAQEENIEDRGKMTKDSQNYKQSVDKAQNSDGALNFSDTSPERDRSKTSASSGIPVITIDHSDSKSNDGRINNNNNSISSKESVDGTCSGSNSLSTKQTSDFVKGSRHHGEKQEHRKSFKGPEVKDKSSPLAEVEDPANRHRRPTLILPPIKTSRELVKK